MGWELVKDCEKSKCWIDLDEIEIYTDGSYKGRKNWKNSIGKKIGARYKWCYDEVDEKWFIIKDYINRYLILVDKNNNEFKIKTSCLCKGRLGKIFDKKTDKFKYNIGDTVNDLVIINREYRKNKKNQNIKWYQYQCEKCGNIDWIQEGNLKNGTDCNVCTNKKVIKGINDIATTNPELIKYFINKEDIYTHTTGSNKKALLKCPDCDYQKEMKIVTLYQHGFGCNKCGDGTSYPEKFVANVLTQLNIKFKTQLSKTDFDWCQNFRYDFYLPDDNRIIETDGGFHYKDAFDKKVEKQQQTDDAKDENASNNGIDLIRIDSRYSTLEWMKENIIEKLGHLFDFSNVDWEEVDRESQKSHMKLACQFKRENQKLTTKEIVELIKEETGIEYSNCTITRWLNRGNGLGLCYYNGKEEMLEANLKGENHPMYGKNHSEETRAKMKKNHYDCKGKNNPMYGRTGEKSPHARKVVSVDPFTKLPVFIWQYKKQANDFYGISNKTLDYYLKGKAKTGHEYNGFLWYYADEWEQLNK